MWHYAAWLAGIVASGLIWWQVDAPSRYGTPDMSRRLIGVALIVLACVASSVILHESAYYETRDFEFWNGEVTKKRPETFSCPTNTSNPCRNGYACNCVTICTGSGDSQTCTTHCDTCYIYDWERDWFVDSNIDSWMIDRVDAQGAKEPPFYTKVNIGDPVSKKVPFTNWVKGAKNSIVKKRAIEGDVSAPDYPSKVYDYYKVDRLVLDDFWLTGEVRAAPYNLAISEILKKAGPAKQMNAVVVLTKKGLARADEIEGAWVGGKKNDLVLVIGVPEYPKVEWARAFSWSRDSMAETLAIDAVNGKTLTPETVAQALGQASTKFERKRLREYEYLKSELEPSVTAILFALFLPLLLAAGFIFYDRQT